MQSDLEAARQQVSAAEAQSNTRYQQAVFPLRRKVTEAEVRAVASATTMLCQCC